MVKLPIQSIMIQDNVIFKRNAKNRNTILRSKHYNYYRLIWKPFILNRTETNLNFPGHNDVRNATRKESKISNLVRQSLQSCQVEENASFIREKVARINRDTPLYKTLLGLDGLDPKWK